MKSPHELVPAAHQSEKQIAIGENLEQMVAGLPAGIKEECLEYLAKLPKGMLERITSSMAVTVGSDDSSIGKLFDAWNKEDRRHDGTYSREDVLEFDDIAAELKFTDIVWQMCSRYVKDSILRCASYEKVDRAIDPFVETLWANRGKEQIDSPERIKLETIERRHGELARMIERLRSRKEDVEKRIGNRQRVPNALREELDKITQELFGVEDQKKRGDFEYLDVRGARETSKRYDGQYKAAVYLAETFSSEEFAVMLSETFERVIHAVSRFDKHVGPELLEYTSRFFNEWAAKHQGEGPLTERQDVDREQKIDRVIRRFTVGLQSYLRHKDNKEFTLDQTETLARELPIILRMLGRL